MLEQKKVSNDSDKKSNKISCAVLDIIFLDFLKKITNTYELKISLLNKYNNNIKAGH